MRVFESNSGFVGECKCDAGYYESNSKVECILCLDAMPYCEICINGIECIKCINNLV